MNEERKRENKEIGKKRERAKEGRRGSEEVELYTKKKVFSSIEIKE